MLVVVVQVGGVRVLVLDALVPVEMAVRLGDGAAVLVPVVLVVEVQVLVFDREPLTTGESPLYQAMPAGGLSATRTYLLKCMGS